MPLPQSERADYEHDLALARSQLDPADFAAAWGFGRAMPAAQAGAAALERYACAVLIRPSYRCQIDDG